MYNIGMLNAFEITEKITPLPAVVAVDGIICN